MSDAPEEFRFADPNGPESLEFRAVSVADALDFVRLHFGLADPEPVLRAHLQCRVEDCWANVEADAAPIE